MEKRNIKENLVLKQKKACIKEASMFEEQKSINKNNSKTFREVCSLFLEDCIKRGLKPTTVITYKKQVNFF